MRAVNNFVFYGQIQAVKTGYSVILLLMLTIPLYNSQLI